MNQPTPVNTLHSVLSTAVYPMSWQGAADAQVARVVRINGRKANK